jgi:hypothetical protein
MGEARSDWRSSYGARKRPESSEAFPGVGNRAGGIRTHGLHVPNVALYQAEPQPVKKKRRLERPTGEVNRGFTRPAIEPRLVTKLTR